MSRMAANSVSQVFHAIGDGQARLLLTITIIVSCGITLWVSKVSGVPDAPGMSPSLLCQPNPILAMALAGLSVLMGAGLAYWLTRIGHQETALFVGAITLMVWAGRGGAMRYVLFASPHAGIFLTLAFELILLYAWVIVAAMLLWKYRIPAQTPEPPDSPLTGIAATGVQILVMASCVLLMCVNDTPAQALMAVGVGALAGGIVAHMTFPVRGAFWIWIGPLFCGIIGYLIAWQYPDGLTIGFPTGPLAPLARATPLAYASAGPAGAILGLWTARSWHQADQNADQNNE